MRFVAVKSEQQQAAGLVFRTRDLLVRQRTQLINAIPTRRGPINVLLRRRDRLENTRQHVYDHYMKRK
jgi:transposase